MAGIPVMPCKFRDQSKSSSQKPDGGNELWDAPRLPLVCIQYSGELAANQRHYPIGLYTGTLNAHADSRSQMTSLSWRLCAGQRAYESDCWALKVQCGCTIAILATTSSGKCLQLRAPLLGFLVWTKKAMRSDRGGNAEAHGQHNTIQSDREGSYFV